MKEFIMPIDDKAKDWDEMFIFTIRKQRELIRCKDCKNSEPWYRDRRRCFLWDEGGVAVWDDGFCNYAERKEK